jgi:riboflavin biosynthesis pyrimidine reductase
LDGDVQFLRPTDEPVDDPALAELYSFPDRLERPWVKAFFISSADGAVEVDGRSAGLSDPDDKRVFHLGRELADVVLVGAGTARAERYRGITPTEVDGPRRLAAGQAEVPPIAVLTNRGSVDPASPLVTDVRTPTLVFTAETCPRDRRTALTDAGAEVVVAGDERVDLAAVLAELDRRGLRRVCCEGGPALFGGLVEAGLLDELCLSLAPLLAVGGSGRIATGPAVVPPVRLTLASVLRAGDLLLLRYLRQ